MRMPGMGELIIILVIVVLVFGANKLPRLGDGIGKAIKNFKRGLNHDDHIDVTKTAHRVEADCGTKGLDDAGARSVDLAERTS
jgi:sec-independent protein translocase protein TatA